MVCLPATQFGCGCSVTFGVKFILILHLALLVGLIGLTFDHLVFGKYHLGAPLAIETIILAISLPGIPMTLVAFSGVLHKNEANVKCYLWYLRLTLIALVIAVVKFLIVSGPFSSCQHAMPDVFKGSGKAWFCGMARWVDLVSIVICLSVIFYFQHIVDSYVDDLHYGVSGPDLTDLRYNKEAIMNKRMSVYSAVEELHQSTDSGFFPNVKHDIYHERVAASLGSGVPLFGGTYHQMTPNPPGSWQH